MFILSFYCPPINNIDIFNVNVRGTFGQSRWCCPKVFHFASLALVLQVAINTCTHKHSSKWRRGDGGVGVARQRVAHADAKPNSKVRVWILLIVVLFLTVLFCFSLLKLMELFFDSMLVALFIVVARCQLKQAAYDSYARITKGKYASIFIVIIEQLSSTCRAYSVLSLSSSLSLILSLSLSPSLLLFGWFNVRAQNFNCCFQNINRNIDIFLLGNFSHNF